MSLYVCTCIYTCVYIYVCMCICWRVYKVAFVYVGIRARMHVCIYVGMPACLGLALWTYSAKMYQWSSSSTKTSFVARAQEYNIKKQSSTNRWWIKRFDHETTIAQTRTHTNTCSREIDACIPTHCLKVSFSITHALQCREQQRRRQQRGGSSRESRRCIHS